MISVQVNQLAEEDKGIAEIHGPYRCFSIYPNSEDYVTATRDVLYEWIVHLNKLPMKLIFAFYEGLEKEYSEWFQKRNISFKLFYSVIDEKKGKTTYKSPLIEATIMNAQDFLSVLHFTFWLPMQNEFFVLSLNGNVSFEERFPYSNNKRKLFVPILDMLPNNTYITIAHDAQGIFLLSNNESYQSTTALKDTLPPLYYG